MTEQFKYTSGGEVYRRKTLTIFQKVVLYLVVFLNILISGLLVLFLGHKVGESPFYLALFMAPTILTFGFLILVVLNPAGPEMDIVLPGSEREPDPSERSTVKGTIRLASGDTLEVEVVVPNVYGISALSGIFDSAAEATSDGLSTPEMYELALDTVCKKYPDARWVGEPGLI